MEKHPKINRLTLKIFAFIILNDLLDTTAKLLIKKGLIFAHHDIFLFWIGLVIYISNFILWMYVLSTIDLSVALPLAGTGYILIPIASIFFLHEFISPLRWLGLVFIVLGITFISKSKPAQVKS